MLNRKQRASLAHMAYKFAELLVAGIVITGIMQPDPPIGKMLTALAFVPFPLIFGLILESGNDDDKPP